MLTLSAIMARTRPAPGGCRIWIGATTGEGYPTVRAGGPGGGKVLAVHRLVIELATGRPIPPGKVAGHKCATPLCVRYGPRHVRAITQGQNIREGRRWA